MNDDAKYVPTKYDSIFWVEVDRIVPNPYQPRREFSEEGLASLAESIRQYGVLQPLVVSRSEVEKDDGGLETRYELIAGERRLRASRIAGLAQVPVVIRHGDSNLNKLELAIIENLQREDLNAIDRAKALQQLINEFGLSHTETAAKIGRSREYVSNSIRLLSLPDHMQQAIIDRDISEGHARPLMSLNDRPEERETLFKEITLKKLPVRAAERIARSIAQERVRPRYRKSPEMVDLEKSLAETLGTRVIIEPNAEEGGRLLIDYFSVDDLQTLIDTLAEKRQAEAARAAMAAEAPLAENGYPTYPNTTQLAELAPDAPGFETAPEPEQEEEPAREAEPADDALYSVSSFTI